MNASRATPGESGPNPSEAATPPPSLAEEVAELAALLRRSAALALIASRGEEPERGARYLLDVRSALQPRLDALALRLLSA
jgi:hypothetical protein